MLGLIPNKSAIDIFKETPRHRLERRFCQEAMCSRAVRLETYFLPLVS